MNGKLQYADRNLFDQEGARKFPDGRCSLENGSFTLPLEAGDNEVVVAIANNFFGWGLMMRLSDAEGVHLAAKSTVRAPSFAFEGWGYEKDGDTLFPNFDNGTAVEVKSCSHQYS
ncbi:MAG TPA: hypothetical protein VNX88_24905 [Terriglobales bacterium]|nr:hypothetical protein [Terriglobales bacterium]